LSQSILPVSTRSIARNPHDIESAWEEHAMIIFALSFCLPCLGAVSDTLPIEPVEIGFTPQFVFDNYIVDNHWAIKYKRQAVRRVFHQAEKYDRNPILGGDQPSHLWVVRDGQMGIFRMYYQANFPAVASHDTDGRQEGLPTPKVPTKGRKYKTYIAYAESKDGIEWEKPHLNLLSWHSREPNNIVIGRLDTPDVETCSPCILDVPEEDRRGYRYLMAYRAKGRGGMAINGIRLIGSQDGIHWDPDSDSRIAHLHSDHHNSISYDGRRGQYVMFCRAKHIYRARGDTMLDTGASRRVARLTSDSLWGDWLAHAKPQTVLVPDEIDNQTHFNFFYGMPSRYWAGVYWGFLEPFRMNDFIYTELTLSRDGAHIARLPERPKLIQYGPDGSWEDEMILASPSWVEVGDQWWIYYSGWDGPHGTTERTGAIGLAKIRKEGFVSMRGPQGGVVVCTRTLRWPGGTLLVNADARDGLLRVRVSDEDRRPIAGFDYDDCHPFHDDSVAHEVTWKDRSLDTLRGRVVRLEFFLQDADLYAFRARKPTGQRRP